LSKYHNFDSNNYEKVRRRAKFEALTKGSQKNNRHRKKLSNIFGEKSEEE
jgi:hypothetical protein